MYELILNEKYERDVKITIFKDFHVSSKTATITSDLTM